MTCEPLGFTIDAQGEPHFADECPPLRTVIDPNAVNLDYVNSNIDQEAGVVTITLDGKTVTYARVAIDLLGNWICDLRVG